MTSLYSVMMVALAKSNSCGTPPAPLNGSTPNVRIYNNADATYLLHTYVYLLNRAVLRESLKSIPPPHTHNKVLIIGDSISLGYGVSQQDTGYGYGLNVAKMLAGPYPEFYSKNLSYGKR